MPELPVVFIAAALCLSGALCRYQEQKYRLDSCGLGKVVYLVEGKLMSTHAVLTVAHIETAVHSTQVCIS